MNAYKRKFFVVLLTNINKLKKIQPISAFICVHFRLNCFLLNHIPNQEKE